MTKLLNTRAMIQEFKRRVQPMELNVEVPMDGDFNAEVAVIAEAGGENEKRLGLPLVGGSGAKLWSVLGKTQSKVLRPHVYITNVIKRQVALKTVGGREARLAVNKHELQHWQAMLMWELKQLPNLRYILCLGGVALDALRPFMENDEGEQIDSRAGINSWRGSVVTVNINGRRVKALLTNNPAMCIRMPETEITFRFDIGKFDRLLRGKYVPYHIKAHINPSFREAIEWIDKMQDDKKPVSLDYETPNNETGCIGLANSDNEGMCINLRTLDANRFSLIEERALLLRLQQLFDDPDVDFIAQNGIFDCSWAWFKDQVKIPKLWIDTLLAHHTLYPTLPHNLGFLTAQYTDHPYYKDEKDAWKEGSGDIDDHWRYNVKDCCVTRKVAYRELAELRAQKLDEFFFNHVMRLQPHLVRMCVGGVKQEGELKGHLVDAMQHDLGELLKQYYDAVHRATGLDDYFPNPLSWQQLQDLFFVKLKLVGRGASTDKENRARMAAHPRTSEAARDMFVLLDKYKEDHKFLSTYAEAENDEDGRMRTEYRQFGTQSAPGRLSSAGTGWKTGQNLQNQPERAKPMFIADEGYGFAYFDLAQAEARFVGWDANIEKWMQDFERARLNPGSYDCHRALASDMWDIPYDEVPEKDFTFTNGKYKHTKRYTAKRCRHGLNYRMQPQRLATKTGLPFVEARQAFNRYHHITPELAGRGGWWDSIEQEVRRRPHTLFNAYGRRWIVLERITDAALESIVAFRPQSSIGDKVNRVIYQSEDDDKWPHNARILLNIHDALICIAPVSKLTLCLSIMKKYAEEPMHWRSIVTGEMCELIIPADCKVTSQKTKWRVDEKTGEIEFYEDNEGFYRWSHMSSIEVEKAA